MKFSATTISVALLLGSVNAFTLHNPTTRSIVTTTIAQNGRLYASTLENETKIMTEDDDEKEKETKKLAVSANHVVLNGRIVERRYCTKDGSYAKNAISPFSYTSTTKEESTTTTTTKTHSLDADTSSSSSSLSSSSSSQLPLHDTSNGIKMTTADSAMNLNLPPTTTTTQTSTSTTTMEENKELGNAKMPNFQTEATDNNNNNESSSSGSGSVSFAERVANSGVASAAAMATAAVNAAVSMKTLSAPDVSKSYIALSEDVTIDEDGLPLVYDRVAIETYWKKEKGALNKRWGVFVGKAVPFLTRLTTLFIKDGSIEEKYIPELSRQARIDLQDLGPTFIKAGQMMSVRPDVLPQVRFEKKTADLGIFHCVFPTTGI